MGGSPPRASAGQGSPTKGDPLLPRWPSWSGAGSSIIRPSSRAGSLPRARLPGARIRPTSWAGSLSGRCPSEGPPARSTMCSASQAPIPPQQPLVRRRRQTPPAMASFIDLATAAFLHPLILHIHRINSGTRCNQLLKRFRVGRISHWRDDIERGRSGLAVEQGGRCRTICRQKNERFRQAPRARKLQCTKRIKPRGLLACR